MQSGTYRTLISSQSERFHLRIPNVTRSLVPEDRATILAALRFYQDSLICGSVPSRIHEIANDNGILHLLTVQDINGLCEEISSGLIVGIGE